MDERIRARRQEIARARLRRRRKVLSSLAALVLLTAAGLAVARSPLFAITEVRIVGLAESEAQAAREAAGLHPGENLLFADLGRASAGVAGLPWVRVAELRRLPPSTVEVRVARREPVAVVRLPGESWLVDGEGVVVAGGAADGLAVIEAQSAVLPAVGEQIRDAVLGAALEVHAGLPDGLRSLVLRYEALRERDLRLHLSGDVTVRFGDAGEIEAKARSVNLLLEQLRRQRQRHPGAADGADSAGEDTEGGATIIDVRAPDNPVLVPARPGEWAPSDTAEVTPAGI